MKKTIALLMVAVLLLATASAVQAGDSWAFSDSEEAEIAVIFSSAFPRDTVQIKMTHYWNGTLLECFILESKKYIALFVYVGGDVEICRIGDMDVAKKAYEIKKEIEKIFDRPASEALGRDHLE